MVGAANTVLYSALLFLFLDVLAWDTVGAVSASYALAMIFHFSANRHITFQSDGDVRAEFGKYLVAAAVSYLISLVVVHVLRSALQFGTVSTALICALITAATGYLLGHYWVYQR
jgi:putative flippase GtrA